MAWDYSTQSGHSESNTVFSYGTKQSHKSEHFSNTLAEQHITAKQGHSALSVSATIS